MLNKHLIIPHLHKVELLVKVLCEARLVLDGVHGVPDMGQQLGEPPGPILREPIGHPSIQALDVRLQLVEVVLLIPQSP